MTTLTDHLLWCDLETTGSDEANDSIIEVGCVLTTGREAPASDNAASATEREHHK